MVILGFILITLLLAAVYTAVAGFVLWKLLLVLLGSYVAVNLIFVLVCSAGGAAVDKTKPLEKQSRACRIGVVAMAEFVDNYLGASVKVSGEEKLPKDGCFLFVCNHRSMADPIIVVDKLRKYNISFVAKPALEKMPLLWRIAYGMGCLPIDRENDREALKSIINASNYIKKGVCSMGVYPEGTRGHGGEMLPFHAGSFKIAQRAGAPLVIASITGTENISKNCPFRRTKISLNILETVQAEEVKRQSTAELAAYSREIIENNIKELQA